MAEWLTVLAALREDQGSVPSTDTMAFNRLQLQFQWIFYPLLDPKRIRMQTIHLHKRRQSTHT